MTTQTPSTDNVTTSTIVSRDGAKINYFTRGSGPAVLVIPGAFSVAASYSAFSSALAEQFTVHTIERRGHGQSSPQGDDYSIAKEREDILALQQKTGASMLVGHSYGGLVALEAARNNPSFTRVAVYEPGVSVDRSIPADWIPGYEKKLAEKKYLDAFVTFARGTGPESIRKIPHWYMKLLLPLIMKSHERELKLSLLQEGLREHKEVARLDNSYPNYREVSASVLYMYGEKYHTAQDAASLKKLIAVFPHAETKGFPGLDHFGIDEKAPQDVARTVSAFFLK